MKPQGEVGLYVHWPFCERICPYCDFFVRRDRGEADLKLALGRAILADMRRYVKMTGPRRLVSIFFGGGTPSLMDPATAAEIIAAARALWIADDSLEVTLEANPTAAEEERFAAFAEAGVTRLSLGVQSLRDTSLRRLGRNHDAAQGRRAALTARRVFRRVSIDLIYALPGQRPREWGEELAEAIDLGCEHLSPYQLTVEPGTALARAADRGRFTQMPADAAADLYDLTQEILGAAGFEPYEISNHAKGATARCRHNLLCWAGGDYVGVGPGAHGRLTLADGRWELAAIADVAAYVRLCEDGAAARPRRQKARETALERLLMGLRTNVGVAMRDLAPLNLAPSLLADLAQTGLIAIEDEVLAVRPRGRLVLDRIVQELVGAS